MNTPPLMVQVFSLIGALLCLLAYVGHQFHWMKPQKIIYNLLNTIGSGILAYLAFRPLQAGFLLMESVWFLVSFIALAKSIRQRK